MKRVELVKVKETIKGMIARLAELKEDKNYMLSTFDFIDPKDEWEYDCVVEEIEELEIAIEDMCNLVYNSNDSRQSIICDDYLYYIDDEDEIRY